LAGRLLGSRSDNWHLLRVPALAEENDPLGREVGEALWPEWEDRSVLLRKRAIVGERAWSALFQQHPRPLQGGLFRVANLALVEPSSVGADGRCGSCMGSRGNCSRRAQRS
jgi:hypothetical protein